ncbi:sulfite exporter TauE/SafE family protein [Dyadobacter tibetensis]|uniref:sulfite exporter TauE/SafE family protein n=1 Tax=Dyadobacter tibetensis TaxID=1211851 RepID=UPI0004709984|nr:sulfite exporter TauE/SafE family protein [Dyadobacter tibetensis]
MEIIGYIASLFIGISLGLIGGGGSILTVPVLVYLLGVDPVQATAYSLFIVGLTSLVGAWPKYRQGLVDTKTAIIFGIPAIAAVYATRKYLVPAIPDALFSVGQFEVSKSIFIMVLFAILMLAASVSMIREKKEECVDCEENLQYNYPIILLEGILVGTLTGLVGAGGGFLIIPALVLLSKLPMKKAVGTSLLIIGAKSLIGFTGDLSNSQMNWMLLGSITFLAIIGFFAGNALSKKVSAQKLKGGFGWFVLAMGLYIIVKELFLH